MTDLPPLREVIAQYDLRAKKSLGQNFLMDLNLTDRIATAGGPVEGATILEIGPGPGGLTRSLLRAGAKKVIAIERDERCLAALSDIADCYPGKLTIIPGDALETDEAPLLASHTTQPVKVIANLPYNIGSKLLIKWLMNEAWPPWFSSLSLLFQKEVAERIAAPPNSKTYGRLSVMAGWRCKSRIAFDIPARAFTPAPKVTSSLVVVTPKAPAHEGVSPKAIEKIVAIAFGQRRKMIKSSLRGLEVSVDDLLRMADINPTVRAENIDVDGFCRLAASYCRLTSNMQNLE